MPLYREFGTLVLHWDLRALKKYWPLISKQVIERFGRGPFQDADTVKKVFHCGYDWALEEFRRITDKQRGVAFYKTVAGLYENTIAVQGHLSKNEPLVHIKEQDFVTNRNGLRLILERACELELVGSGTLADISNEQADVIEDLLYLTTWIWSFAEGIAHQQVMGDIQDIHVDPDDTLRIQRKGDWDEIIVRRRSEMIRLGQGAISDYVGMGDLIRAFEKHLLINYKNNSGFIPAPEGIHPFAEYPLLVDFPYEDSITTLASNSRFDLGMTRKFYGGLSIRPDNMPGLDQIIRKPGGSLRHMYRPILVWKVDGQLRAVCGPNRWGESMALIAINALQWNEVPAEWMTVEGFKKFVHEKHNAHDKILEARFELALKGAFPHYHGNVSALETAKSVHARFDGAGLGQVDFLFLSHAEQKVYVVECKYSRPRHDMIGYRMDQSRFESEHEPKLERKVKWFKDNLSSVEKHFSLRYPDSDIRISDYSVEGMFVVNTPTIYCFKGRFRADSIVQFEDWAQSFHGN